MHPAPTSHHCRYPQSILMCLLLILLVQASSSAQRSFTQTIPQGHENLVAGSGTSFPFQSQSNSIFHWHYDTSNFVESGAMMINEVYVRSLIGSSVDEFDYADLTITMIEASTDYLSHDSTFANNIVRGEEVRSGPFLKDSEISSDNGVTGGWIPLRFEKGFLYDPSTGNDLIIEVKTTGVNVDFDAFIETHLGLGSRHAHLTNSSSPIINFTQQTRSPVLKLDYTPVLEQTVPVGEMGANSNSSTFQIVNTTNEQVWQWHYDSSNFTHLRPITITEISVRADSPNVDVNAFEYGNFEVTLIEASTDYKVGNHANIFDDNVYKSQVVRSGVWKAPATPATNGSTSTWISLQLTDTFRYDPNEGRDFIIQVRICNPITTWGTNLDSVFFSGAGTVGGNRYGHTTDCQSIVSTSSSNEFVPTAKISYTFTEIFSYPYQESFDQFGAKHATNSPPPGWHRPSHNVDGWRFHNRESTPGSALVDHTTKKVGNGFYAILDDSESNSDQESLQSPIFFLGPLFEPIVSFWVYSSTTLDPVGLDANSFRLDVVSHQLGGDVIIKAQMADVTIQRHGCWTKFAVRIGGYGSDRVSLLFNGTTNRGTGGFHDFAMDDFELREALPSEGGQAPGIGRLDINECYNNNGEHLDAPVDGPFYACGKAGGEFNIKIKSTGGFRAAALWFGPLNVGVATYGVNGQMDTGTPDTNGDGLPENLFTIGNAFSPSPNVIDNFFYTDSLGNLDLSFQLNPFLPPGLMGTFQAAVSNGPAGIFLTNAVQFRIEE